MGKSARKKKDPEQQLQKQAQGLCHSNPQYFAAVPDNEGIFTELMNILRADYKGKLYCPACVPKRPITPAGIRFSCKSYKKVKDLINHTKSFSGQQQDYYKTLQHQYQGAVMGKFLLKGENADPDGLKQLDFRQNQPEDDNERQQDSNAQNDDETTTTNNINNNSNNLSNNNTIVGQKRSRVETESDLQGGDVQVSKFKKFESFGDFNSWNEVVWPPIIMIQGIIVKRTIRESTDNNNNDAGVDSSSWEVLTTSIDDLQKFVLEQLKIPEDCLQNKVQFLLANNNFLLHPNAKVLKSNGSEYGLGTAYFQLTESQMTQTILLELYRAIEGHSNKGRYAWRHYLAGYTKGSWSYKCQKKGQKPDFVPSEKLYLYEADTQDIHDQFPQEFQKFIFKPGAVRQIMRDKYHNSIKLELKIDPVNSNSVGNTVVADTVSETLPNTQDMQQNSENYKTYDEAESTPCFTHTNTQEILAQTQILDQLNKIDAEQIFPETQILDQYMNINAEDIFPTQKVLFQSGDDDVLENIDSNQVQLLGKKNVSKVISNDQIEAVDYQKQLEQNTEQYRICNNQLNAGNSEIINTNFTENNQLNAGNSEIINGNLTEGMDQNNLNNSTNLEFQVETDQMEIVETDQKINQNIFMEGSCGEGGIVCSQVQVPSNDENQVNKQSGVLMMMDCLKRAKKEFTDMMKVRKHLLSKAKEDLKNGEGKLTGKLKQIEDQIRESLGKRYDQAAALKIKSALETCQQTFRNGIAENSTVFKSTV